MTELIQERRELRRLLQRLTLAKVRDYLEVERVEREIESLVLRPLDLDIYSRPNRSQLAIVAQAILFKAATTFELLDRPETVFDNRLSETVSWVPSVKARLIELCGPFEHVAARLLQSPATSN